MILNSNSNTKQQNKLRPWEFHRKELEHRLNMRTPPELLLSFALLTYQIKIYKQSCLNKSTQKTRRFERFQRITPKIMKTFHKIQLTERDAENC